MQLIRKNKNIFPKLKTPNTKSAEKVKHFHGHPEASQGQWLWISDSLTRARTRKASEASRAHPLLNHSFGLSARRAGLRFCHAQARNLQQLSQRRWGWTSDNPATTTPTAGTEGQAPCFEDVIALSRLGKTESHASRLCMHLALAIGRNKNKRSKYFLKRPQWIKLVNWYVHKMQTWFLGL